MVIPDLSMYDYHALPDVSSSDLRALRRSPAHFKYAKANPKVSTDAMRLGTLEHTLLLEPDTFSSRYISGGKKIDGRTKEGREQKKWQEEQEADGKEVCYDGQVEDAMAMVESIMEHEEAAKIINTKGAKTEETYISRLHDMPVKCRPDLLLPNGTIVDLKTCRDAREWAFSKVTYEFGYHIQAAFYIDILNRENNYLLDASHLIIAVESEPPYALEVYELDYVAIQEGRKEYQKNLEYLKECIEYDSWPKYGNRRKTLYLPKYAYTEKQLINMENEL